MHAYIDESGDEGTAGRGSRWLTFGVVCVADAHVADLEELARTAQTAVGKGKPIHFNEMTHPDRKGVARLLGIAAAPWVGIIIASDTQKVQPGSHLKHPRYQYNYALRYALSFWPRS